MAYTGDFVNDFLADSTTLGPELERILSTVRDLDKRSEALINLARDQTEYCMRVRADDHATLDKIIKDIKTNQENALRLSTEKVLLAQQAHDMIESQIKRLDEHLNQLAEDLKQEGKIPPDEQEILALTSRELKLEGRNLPQSKSFAERERKRITDLKLMPPPGTHKNPINIDADEDKDPKESRYCVCHQVSFGDMIACDNANCQGGQWFHFSCVGIPPNSKFKGKWFCPICRRQK